MELHLSQRQQELHLRAVKFSRLHCRLEGKMISVLQDVDRTKLYKKFGRRSLFQYAVAELGMTEPVANTFISVSRKAAEVSQLQIVIEKRSLSVAKASRIVSAITSENADQLIEFARTHTTRETDFEVARLRPKAAAPDRAKPLTEDLVKLEMSVSKQIYVKLKRVQSLLASKTKSNAGFESVLDAVLTEYIERHDPVRKAARASARKQGRSQPEPTPEQTQKLCANRVFKKKPAREKLTADTKHTVFARDGGRCTHIDAAGRRCESDRWLHIHHIGPLSQGGTDHPENLTTLCSFHHDMVHQLSLPIDGQVSWLRSPQATYGLSG